LWSSCAERRYRATRAIPTSRWRAWLNNHLIDRWFRNGRYYQLNLVSGDHKNPEYRIADDVRVATEAPVDFATGMTTAVLSAATSCGAADAPEGESA
jgi:vitamin B12/bleomycin/antimicrobial peptide transport system ATP-binding/permease protein